MILTAVHKFTNGGAINTERLFDHTNAVWSDKLKTKVFWPTPSGISNELIWTGEVVDFSQGDQPWLLDLALDVARISLEKILESTDRNDHVETIEKFFFGNPDDLSQTTPEGS